MYQRIVIMGLNGSGKSTLCHALCKHLGFFEMDVEDYYFPEQASSRRYALEHTKSPVSFQSVDLPFSHPRSKSEVEETLLRDMISHPQFVLSGVTMNWDQRIRSMFEIAFLLKTPKEVRIRRVQEREMRRFGDRVMPGGDMFKQQEAFRSIIGEKDENFVLESAKGLACPVVQLDGEVAIEENVQRVLSVITGTVDCDNHHAVSCSSRESDAR